MQGGVAVIADGSYHMLVATQSVQRRAITINSEVHALPQLSSRGVENHFLSGLVTY